jgi:hypothetical protein
VHPAPLITNAPTVNKDSKYGSGNASTIVVVVLIEDDVVNVSVFVVTNTDAAIAVDQ